MSLVWKHFTIETHKSTKAQCKLCDAMIPRGGQKMAAFNTTNMTKHLENHHPKEHEEIEKAKQTRQAKETQDDSGIKTMKRTLLEAVNRRFGSIEGVPYYSVATLVDPRYKDRFFTAGALSDKAREAKDVLLAEMRKVDLKKTQNDGAAAPTSAADTTKPASTEDSATTEEEPAEKVLRIEEEAAHPGQGLSSSQKSSLASLYEDILMEQGDSGAGSSDGALTLMQGYFQEPVIGQKESPFLFWEKNHGRFPALAAVALQFLSAPSTSVESERLFSTTSNIVDEKRNRLTAEHAEMLIFLKKNLVKFS